MSAWWYPAALQEGEKQSGSSVRRNVYLGAERHVVDAEQLKFCMRPGASLVVQIVKNLSAV